MLEGNLHLRQPELFALIEDDRTAQRCKQEHLGADELGAIAVAAPARDGARRVMVLESPTRPADIGRVWPILQRANDQRRSQLFGIEEVEAVGAVQPPIALGERAHLAKRIVAADFRDGEGIAGNPAQPFQEIDDRRM